MLFSMASMIKAELTRLQEQGFDWRARLLRKTIYEVEPDLRPVPDGLSKRYIEIASSLNKRASRRAIAEVGKTGSGLLEMLEMAVQEEVATAILREHQLHDVIFSDTAAAG